MRKFILSAIGLFLASAGLTTVTTTPADAANCKFPSRIECEVPGDGLPKLTPPPVDTESHTTPSTEYYGPLPIPVEGQVPAHPQASPQGDIGTALTCKRVKRPHWKKKGLKKYKVICSQA